MSTRGTRQTRVANPYHCVEARKTGTGRLRLDMRIAAYAEGVQHFEREVLVLKRGPAYLLCDLLDAQPSAIVTELSPTWLRAHFPSMDGIGPDTDLQAVMNRLLGDPNGPHQRHHP